MKYRVSANKRVLAIAAIVMLFIVTAVPAFAVALPDSPPDPLPETRQLPRLVDEADILTPAEEAELTAKLDSISESLQCDVAVVTVNDIGTRDAEEYADDYYDYNGFGYGENHDGMLLMVCMGTRDWHISTTGFCIYAFDDAGIGYISDRFVSKLSDGDYAGAFTAYADTCDMFIAQARTGEPYRAGNLPRGKVSWLWVPGSMLIGLLPAWVTTSSMKSQLRPNHVRMAPSRYARKTGSECLRAANELFVTRNVTRSARVSSSGGGSTHIGSSGRTHGGGGGKF